MILAGAVAAEILLIVDGLVVWVVVRAPATRSTMSFVEGQPSRHQAEAVAEIDRIAAIRPSDVAVVVSDPYAGTTTLLFALLWREFERCMAASAPAPPTDFDVLFIGSNARQGRLLVKRFVKHAATRTIKGMLCLPLGVQVDTGNGVFSFYTKPRPGPLDIQHVDLILVDDAPIVEVIRRVAFLAHIAPGYKTVVGVLKLHSMLAIAQAAVALPEMAARTRPSRRLERGAPCALKVVSLDALSRLKIEPDTE